MKSPFRSIRQTLFLRRQGYEGHVISGKLLRYLGYAIGEIALIIIGILFALKINNMNEDRKAQAEFDLYIVQLKVDVRKAIENVEFAIGNVEKFKEEQDYIFEFLKLSEYTSEDLAKFEAGLFRLGSTYEPQVYVGLLGDLMNGNTTIISRDRDLVQKARETESSIEGSLNAIQRNSERIALYAANLPPFFGPGLLDRSRRPNYNLEQLRSSEEFKNNADAIMKSMRAHISFDESIIRRLESFLTVLEEYE